MRYLAAITLLAAAAVPSRAAESRWTRLRTDHFELYTSAGPRAARDTIKTFEQVRGFFAKAIGPSPTAKAGPVRLVAFGSPKEFEPHRINEFAIAYYAESMERDYIVMSRAGADVFSTAVHEYVHLLVHRSGLRLPPWLSEGIAELYSTLKPIGNQAVVGELIPGRHRALLEEKWVPLATILAADRDSPYYNEKSKAGSLYNEGWALTHMLNFEPRYRPKFPELLRAVSGGKDSAQALGDVYGRSTAQVDHDLQAYLRGTSFKAAVVDAKMERRVEEIAAEPVTEFDAALVLADLHFGAARDTERERAFQRLNAEDPQRPEPYRGLGEIAWRRGSTQAAVELFGKAYARGDRDPRFLWDYGRLLERSDEAEAAKILSELLAQDPRLEVRLELAEIHVRRRDAKAALDALTPIRKVTPDEAARFFKVAVYAHLLNGDRQNAEGTARRFLETAKSDADRGEAETLVRLSAAVERAPAAMPERVEISEGERPIIRRAGPVPAAAADETPVERPSVSGRFVELDCRGAQARMIVETADGRKAFLIEDPAKVAITAGAEGPVDLQCGVQKKPARVQISYDLPRNAGIAGIVRTLAF